MYIYMVYIYIYVHHIYIYIPKHQLAPVVTLHRLFGETRSAKV